MRATGRRDYILRRLAGGERNSVRSLIPGRMGWFVQAGCALTWKEFTRGGGSFELNSDCWVAFAEEMGRAGGRLFKWLDHNREAGLMVEMAVSGVRQAVASVAMKLLRGQIWR